jgi:hypothetical protein
MDDIALQLLREYATRSLRNFVGVFWPVLENDRPVAWGWALDAMADHLEAVTRGEITRLVINVPPGSMKSLMVSVMWPAWEWAIGRPQTKIIGVAHNTALSGRDARKMRRLVQSQEYRDLFPHVELTKDQNSKLNFENTAYGQRVCMAFRNMTGERGDRVIIDDPMTVEDGFSKAAIDEAARIFNETVPSRVNDSKSAIVMIMQRIHESDPASIALSDPMYEKLIIPMRWDSKFPTETKRFRDPRDGGPDGVLFFPERFSADQVEALERRLGPYGTASQLQQQPAPRSGGYLDPSNIGVADRRTCGCAVAGTLLPQKGVVTTRSGRWSVWMTSPGRCTCWTWFAASGGALVWTPRSSGRPPWTVRWSNSPCRSTPVPLANVRPTSTRSL